MKAVQMDVVMTLGEKLGDFNAGEHNGLSESGAKYFFILTVVTRPTSYNKASRLLGKPNAVISQS